MPLGAGSSAWGQELGLGLGECVPLGFGLGDGLGLPDGDPLGDGDLVGLGFGGGPQMTVGAGS